MLVCASRAIIVLNAFMSPLGQEETSDIFVSARSGWRMNMSAVIVIPKQ